MRLVTTLRLAGIALGLVLVGLLNAQQPLAPAPKYRLAVLIGISKYDDKSLTLPTPAADVDEIESRLKRLGFDVIKLTSPPPAAKDETKKQNGKKENGKRQPRTDATRENMLKLFRDELRDKLRGKTEDETLLLVYIAAHGAQDQGKGYLLPADAKRPETDKDYVKSWYSTQVLNQQIQSQPAKYKVLLIEACRTVLTPGSGRAPPLVGDEDVRGDYYIVESSRPGTASQADKEFQRGVFAHYFIEALQKRGALADQISLHAVLNSTRTKTAERTKDEQVPEVFPIRFEVTRNDVSLGARRGMQLAGTKDAPRKVEAKQVVGATADATEPLATFRFCDFSPVKDVKEANFSLATFENVSLEGVDLTQANLSFAVFKNVNLKGAKMGPSTILTGTTFEDVNWEGAELTGADFRFLGAAVDEEALKKAAKAPRQK